MTLPAVWQVAADSFARSARWPDAAAGRKVFVEICGAEFWFDPDLGTLDDIDQSEPDDSVDTYPAVTPIWTGSELLFWGLPFCYPCDEILPPRFVSLAPPASA